MLAIIISGATFGGGIGAVVAGIGFAAWMVWGGDEE
jgi:hypothetical protein